MSSCMSSQPAHDDDSAAAGDSAHLANGFDSMRFPPNNQPTFLRGEKILCQPCPNLSQACTAARLPPLP